MSLVKASIMFTTKPPNHVSDMSRFTIATTFTVVPPNHVSDMSL